MATDKTVTIKGATDTQLTALIARLRNECEAQRLIADLIRSSTPDKLDAFGNKDYTYPTVSTEAPIESMYHVGIPGMKWGVRNIRGSSSEKPSGGRIPKGSGGKLDKNVFGTAKDYTRARQLKAKGKRRLSNDELKELTTRMDLEAKYNKLNPSKLKRGMDAVKVMKSAGDMAVSVYKFTQSDTGKKIIASMKKRGR